MPAVTISYLKWGGFHLVVTEVLPVSGGEDEKVNFYKNDLRIAQILIFWGGGALDFRVSPLDFRVFLSNQFLCLRTHDGN